MHLLRNSFRYARNRGWAPLVSRQIADCGAGEIDRVTITVPADLIGGEPVSKG